MTLGIKPSEFSIHQGNLSSEGFVLLPAPELWGAEAATSLKLQPHSIAAIPNPCDFSEGPDFFGNGLIVKYRGQMEVLIPKNFQPFLPVIQMALNYECIHRGAQNVRDRFVFIRASRHTSTDGYPHQLEAGKWHNHHENGPSSYYLAIDICGTPFRSWIAPDYSVARFEENDEHYSPVIGNRRRTLFTIAFCEKNPDPRGRDKMFLHPMTATDEKMIFWREAGRQALSRSYPAECQAQHLTRWRQAALNF